MKAGGLQRELKRKTPFDSAQQEANLNVIRTADQMINRCGKFFRDYGLTTSQYNVLRILRNEGAALPSLEIGQRMVQTVPAITGLIDRLEKQDLVVRRRCDQDRRVVYVQITAAGKRLLRKIDAPLIDLHHQISGTLTKAELKEVSRLMEKVRAAMEASDQ
ncbi:MarR family winged helix-turn-helix transcriptional regulator [Crateriforma conspicua]|uniref:HTH-type transcriptional regulator MhqR n=1 Tax=Crateriforma conspicua TaxID=2527996 RepID=A0A5C6FW07_9PLAN|nr:MarR family transcriptional regulator [Crateriforma conspicua]TWU67109.1 HTH-type transcriptional regulator MhqR [Crateriforma conspicua]